MIKLTFEGQTLTEVHEAIRVAALEVSEVSINVAIDPKSKALASTPNEQGHSTDTTSEGKTSFDDVEYSGENTTRNLWILLTDGRVIAIKSGGALPVDEIREKNITKKEYLEIEEDEPERVAKGIGEVVEEKAKKKTVEKPKDDEDDSEEEETDSADDMAEAKKLIAEVKDIAGGKRFVKELLADYDVKRVSKIEDEDDLADFIADLEGFIEENED